MTASSTGITSGGTAPPSRGASRAPDAADPTPATRVAYDSAAFGRALAQWEEVGESDWRLVREVARQNGTSEVRALLDLGLMSEDGVADALARWSGVERWRARDEEEEDGAGVVSDAAPVEFMRSNAVLVLEEESTVEDAGDDDGPETAARVRVVLADPSDRFVWNAVAGRLGGRIGAVSIGTQKEIHQYLDRHAPGDGEDRRAEEEGGAAIDVSGELAALRELASEAPVIRFLNQAVERAMELGASDIHLERFDRRVSLRYRVDGVLVEQPPPAPRMYEPLLCRIKIMSNLDIAERRRAQDGRIRMRLRGRNIDMRVSIVPTTYGQDAAIRLQDRQRLADIDLRELGFSAEHVGALRHAARKSHGILLITGPTGSGKTTTLYGLLRELASIDRKVITVEDPVEYAMDGVNQIQVNAAIGLTFGTTLRNILRHDPDVILVGEIRDSETAQMAFQSALTGHMVLSTLHTNDVPSSFVRLIDMGVEPYLVNAGVVGVSAQRLLRRLYRPESGGGGGSGGGDTGVGGRGGGGEASRVAAEIGYKGRVAVMEFAEVTPSLKRLMLQGADEHRIRELLLQEGYLPMRADAERLVGEGITDEAEVARVLGQAAPPGLEE